MAQVINSARPFALRLGRIAWSRYGWEESLIVWGWRKVAGPIYWRCAN